MRKYLLIDGQVFQTPAFHRGMGKYSAELVSQLAKDNESGKKWEKIVLILSSELQKSTSNSLDEIRHEIHGDIEVELIPLARNEISPRRIIEKNRKIIDDYIQANYDLTDSEFDFLMLSPMQGELCSVFPSLTRVFNIALCYDVIPLMFWRIYLQNPITVNEYLSKLKELFRADTYACISKTCANDLVLFLGIDSNRTININGGPIEHSSGQTEYSVEQPYILMPTGDDLRKNNRKAILAFKNFNKKHGDKYRLVITSFFSEQEEQTYKSICENLTFTGNISGDQLHYLYANCDALLFIPHYEGLGLPILEAMAVERPIVCSDIAVFREITTEGVEFCDQNSQRDIETALENACAEGYKISRATYKSVLKKYSWESTAKLFKEEVLSRRAQNHIGSIQHKQRVQIHGADPSSKEDDLAFFMQTLQSELGRLVDPGYQLSDDIYRPARMNFLPYVAQRHMNVQAKHIYFIDDEAAYATTLVEALGTPGLVVLRSASIKNAWDHLLKKGWVSSGRYDAEKVLNARCGHEGSFIVSLVASGSSFITFDIMTEKILKDIANAIDKKIRVKVVGMPEVSLPYPEILPQKAGVVSDNQRDLKNKNKVRIINHGEDYRYFDALSRSEKLLIGPGKEQSFRAAIARALGVEVTVESTSPAKHTKQKPASLKQYAEMIANEVTVRSSNDGNSI